MFENSFFQELSRRIGSNVEVATDNNLIEGLLSGVTEDLLLVIEVASGYGDNTNLYISLDAINFVRFPQATA